MDLRSSAPVCFPWNGSKRWLLPHLQPLVSRWFAASTNGTYLEPFAGAAHLARAVRASAPSTSLLLNDANLWLMSLYRQQQSGEAITISPNQFSVERIHKFRNLADSSLTRSGMTVQLAATRFLVCLLTCWGNRWEAKPDGRFRSTLNNTYCDPVKLASRICAVLNDWWLTAGDTILAGDWQTAVAGVQRGDLVYIDPPYPESLGYGNNQWRFKHLLDLVDWCAEAHRDGVYVILSNMDDVQRLLTRIGYTTSLVNGPRTTKTKKARVELIAHNIEAA